MPAKPFSDPAPLRLDHTTLRRIEAYAHATRTSPELVIRDAFDEFESKHPAITEANEPSAYDVLVRNSLVGCVRSNQDHDDLATNPSHMADFGRD